MASVTALLTERKAPAATWKAPAWSKDGSEAVVAMLRRPERTWAPPEKLLMPERLRAPPPWTRTYPEPLTAPERVWMAEEE